MSGKTRVLVIGMDGATPELLFPWAKEGKLPNLNKIINNGTIGNLKSTYPPQSATAWTSFMTGKNPGKHGIFHFLKRNPESYEYLPVNAKDNRAKTIWSILSEHNKKVGVMNVPITYPPDKVNGFIITGLGTPSHESDFTYPIELKEKLLNQLNYKIQTTEFYKKNNENFFLEDVYNTEQKKTDIAIFLMKNYEWDFFIVVFMGADQIQHFFWKYRDKTHPAHNSKEAEKYGSAILRYYQKLDEFVGNITKYLDNDTNVIIMSDHGGGPLHKELHLNYYLRELGLLSFKKTRKSKINYWLLKLGFSMENIYELASAIKLQRLSNILPKKIIGNIPKHDMLSLIDWDRTKAYSHGNMGLMYINLKGREPNGIVTPEEYDELRDYIIKELYKLKDPETGKNIVDKVFKKEEIYNGECLEDAPDLFIVPEMQYHEIASFSDVLTKPTGNIDEIDFRLRRSGQHRLNGILLMEGKNIKKGITIKNAEIIDLAPTILYMIGIRIPSDMDGKVLKDAFDPLYLESNPIQYEDILQYKTQLDYEWSKEDEEKVKERLRTLGYM